MNALGDFIPQTPSPGTSPRTPSSLRKQFCQGVFTISLNSFLENNTPPVSRRFQFFGSLQSGGVFFTAFRIITVFFGIITLDKALLRHVRSAVDRLTLYFGVTPYFEILPEYLIFGNLASYRDEPLYFLFSNSL